MNRVNMPVNMNADKLAESEATIQSFVPVLSEARCQIEHTFVPVLSEVRYPCACFQRTERKLAYFRK
jgi:hypothetical protein